MRGVLHQVLGEAREGWEKGWDEVGWRLGGIYPPGEASRGFSAVWPRILLHQLLCSVDPTRSGADDSQEWAKTVWRERS